MEKEEPKVFLKIATNCIMSVHQFKQLCWLEVEQEDQRMTIKDDAQKGHAISL